tara:strand:- start:10605 stop:10919 length:315 start_codon:yes stop_codon:yes gene_type:complete
MAASYYVGSSPTIQVTCKDKVDGTVINLTNYDVEIAYSIDGGTVTNVDMTPVGGASGGIEKYTFPTANLDAEGDLEIQIILKSTADSTVLKSDFIRRRVIKALA